MYDNDYEVVQLTNEEYEAIMEAREELEYMYEKAESTNKRLEKLADKGWDKKMGFYPGASERKKAYNGDDIAGRSARIASAKRHAEKDPIYARIAKHRIEDERDQHKENLKNALKYYHSN